MVPLTLVHHKAVRRLIFVRYLPSTILLITTTVDHHVLPSRNVKQRDPSNPQLYNRHPLFSIFLLLLIGWLPHAVQPSKVIDSPESPRISQRYYHAQCIVIGGIYFLLLSNNDLNLYFELQLYIIFRPTMK